MFAEESPDFLIDDDDSATCEMCGGDGAVIHLLRVQDGVVTHTRLCHACAETLAGQTEGVALVLAAPAALRHLAKTAPADSEKETTATADDVRMCTVCGTTLAALKETGMVGCPVCYKVFAEYLAEAVQEGAEPLEHEGKIPRAGSEVHDLRHEVTRLKRMLRELVETERFEEAAGVRDRLVDLSRDMGEDAS